MLHKLKIEARYLHRIITKQKSFEVRINDRDYQVGDFIEFKVLLDDNQRDFIREHFEKEQTPIPYYQIVYVHTGYGLAKNFVILGIRESGEKSNAAM